MEGKKCSSLCFQGCKIPSPSQWEPWQQTDWPSRGPEAKNLHLYLQTGSREYKLRMLVAFEILRPTLGGILPHWSLTPKLPQTATN